MLRVKTCLSTLLAVRNKKRLEKKKLKGKRKQEDMCWYNPLTPFWAPYFLCAFFQLQCLAGKLDILTVYDVNWGTLNGDFLPYKCSYAVFELIANRYGFGLLNELLFIIIPQEAAKLWSIKDGGLKKLPCVSPFYLVKRSLIFPTQEFFSDLKLWQLTVLQPLKLLLCSY